MITYEKSNRVKFVGLALVLGVGAGVGVWWLQGGRNADDPQVVATAASGSGVTAWFKGGSTDAGQLHDALHPAMADDGRPQDVDADDWKTLHAALAKAGIDAKQGPRVVSFLRYQHMFEDWQNIDETKEMDRRRRVGEALLAEVPERMKSGEFTVVEANLMGSVLIAGLETDEQARAKRMEDWQASIAKIAPMPTDEKALQEQFKKVEFDRRVAAAYDDWQKTDPKDPARSPGKLEAALTDVKRAANSGEL